MNFFKHLYISFLSLFFSLIFSFLGLFWVFLGLFCVFFESFLVLFGLFRSFFRSFFVFVFWAFFGSFFGSFLVFLRSSFGLFSTVARFQCIIQIIPYWRWSKIVWYFSCYLGLRKAAEAPEQLHKAFARYWLTCFFLLRCLRSIDSDNRESTPQLPFEFLCNKKILI